MKQNPSITHNEISQVLLIPIDTLRKTHNHRILAKAREAFKLEKLESLREVAFYLKKEGII